MAGLARDIDLGECSRVGVGRGAVVAAQIGRMALRAHEVPILLPAGPVQRVTMVDLLVGIEMEPALPALGLGACIPGNRERLKPPARQFDQILLPGRDPEGELDLEIQQFAAHPISPHHELTVAPEEDAGHVAVAKMRVVEIAEDGRVGRMRHGARACAGSPSLHAPRLAACRTQRLSNR